MTRHYIKVRNHIEIDEYRVAILCDFSKAFHCVNFKIIPEIQEYMSIRGSALNWVFEFGNQKWRCNSTNFRSQFIEVEIGLPQGSALGRIPFIAYVYFKN